MGWGVLGGVETKPRAFIRAYSPPKKKKGKRTLAFLSRVQGLNSTSSVESSPLCVRQGIPERLGGILMEPQARLVEPTPEFPSNGNKDWCLCGWFFF